MKYHFYYLMCFTCMLNSCQSNIEPDNKRALKELANRYTGLYKNDPINQYKITRKVYNNVDSIELQLLEKDNGEGQIVILSNYKQQVYAVPLPANQERYYWRFYGDRLNTPINNKTFDQELSKAFKTLDKTGWRWDDILNDMMISLIGARPLLDKDTSVMNKFARENYPPTDSCGIKFRNNNEEIIKGIKPESSNWEYYPHWGALGRTYQSYRGAFGRIYQFDFVKENNKYINCNIKVYKQPCLVLPLKL